MILTEEERVTLSTLDRVLDRARRSRRVRAIVRRVEAKLAADPSSVLAWEPVPLDVYGRKLPAAVRSSWVFVLRARRLTGAERHPNSIQRMASLRGVGDLETWRDGEWRSNALVSDPKAPWERRWVSVPVNVWHQAVVPADEDWVVLSFHTAAERELIEERGDPARESRLRRRRYVD